MKSIALGSVLAGVQTQPAKADLAKRFAGSRMDELESMSLAKHFQWLTEDLAIYHRAAPIGVGHAGIFWHGFSD